MHKPGLILGYTAFAPETTTVLYGDEVRSLAGNKTFVRREVADIVWVRETGAYSFFTFKGRIVKRLEQFNDFYGLATSVSTIVKEIPGVTRRWQIERDSELEIHVVAWVIDTPTLGFELTDYGRNYYKPLPRMAWYDHPDAKADLELNEDSFPFGKAERLETIRHTATVVWKSSNSEEENAAALAAYLELAKATDRKVIVTDVEIPD
jgi:hypothetical protein